MCHKEKMSLRFLLILPKRELTPEDVNFSQLRPETGKKQ
jgi:hypothetical protein